MCHARTTPYRWSAGRETLRVPFATGIAIPFPLPALISSRALHRPDGLSYCTRALPTVSQIVAHNAKLREHTLCGMRCGLVAGLPVEGHSLSIIIFDFAFTFLRSRLRSRTGLAARRASWDVMRTHTHQRSVRCVVARYDTRRPREPHTLQLRVRAPFFPVPIPPSPLPGLAWPRVGQDMRPAAAAVVLVAAAMPTRTYTFCQDVETHRRQAATHLESITLLAPEQGPASGRVKLASSSSSSSSPPLPLPSPQGPACGKSPRTSFGFLPHLPSACHGHRHARGPGGAPQCRHSLGGRDGGLRGAPPSRFSQRGPDGQARAIRAAWMSRHVCRRPLGDSDSSRAAATAQCNISISISESPYLASPRALSAEPLGHLLLSPPGPRPWRACDIPRIRATAAARSSSRPPSSAKHTSRAFLSLHLRPHPCTPPPPLRSLDQRVRG